MVFCHIADILFCLNRLADGIIVGDILIAAEIRENADNIGVEALLGGQNRIVDGVIDDITVGRFGINF
ncbi:MAG: hypothetical protein J6I45_09755 [Clostridia bacterium]|nr:hypothetical protein [Clostridia bacterium]